MKLKIAYYNDPVLRKKAERVNQIDDELRQLVSDMIETMQATNGIGLAAPQVHRSLALFITYVSFQDANGEWLPEKLRVYLNPQILSYSDKMQVFAEGCLSIPNIHINVKRPASIKILATDLDGNPIEDTLTGFPATNFMHEFDHLNGILITDHLSPKERQELEKLFRAR